MAENSVPDKGRGLDLGAEVDLGQGLGKERDAEIITALAQEMRLGQQMGRPNSVAMAADLRHQFVKLEWHLTRLERRDMMPFHESVLMPSESGPAWNQMAGWRSMVQQLSTKQLADVLSRVAPWRGDLAQITFDEIAQRVPALGDRSWAARTSTYPQLSYGLNSYLAAADVANVVAPAQPPVDASRSAQPARTTVSSGAQQSTRPSTPSAAHVPGGAEVQPLGRSALEMRHHKVKGLDGARRARRQPARGGQPARRS